MNSALCRTTIVATMGPASQSPEILRQLVLGGIPSRAPLGTNFLKLHTVGAGDPT